MAAKFLFLDIDHVLNTGQRHPGSVYCGIDPQCMAQLNRVIDETGCSLVITSAWRYQMLLCHMTTAGFEALLFTHGLIAPWGIVAGCTRKDASPECCDRGEQIMEWLGENGLHRKTTAWAVVDDNPMDIQLGDSQWRLVTTSPTVGLYPATASRLIEILGKKEVCSS